MKNNLHLLSLITLIGLAFSLYSSAQTNLMTAPSTMMVTSSLLTNYAKSHGLTVKEAVTNADFQKTFFYQVHGYNEIDVISNLQKGSQPSFGLNLNTRNNCCSALQFSISNIQNATVILHVASLLAVHQLNNQAAKDGPIVTTAITNDLIFKKLGQCVNDSLYELKKSLDFLTSDQIRAHNSDAGIFAEVSNSGDLFQWLFWSEDGPVRQYTKKDADGKRIAFMMHFFTDGRLESFTSYTPNEEGLTFTSDGKLGEYFFRNENNVEIDIKFDVPTDFKIKSFIEK